MLTPSLGSENRFVPIDEMSLADRNKVEGLGDIIHPIVVNKAKHAPRSEYVRAKRPGDPTFSL